ncbi:MAG: hypothetical protein H6739_03010 [Alphaproteobacteria bacterium]|nr:hypothetical protein [Alphaproteobacteria bacterium]
MDPLVRNVVAAGVALGVGLLLGPLRRWGWLSGLLLGGAVGVAFAIGVADTARPWEGAPLMSLAVLVGWLALGSVARACGGAFSLGGMGGTALLSGALMGDLAAAALLAPQCEDPRDAAKVALVASAGGMLGPLGTPAGTLLVGADALWPLALVTALVAWPRGPAPEGNPMAAGVLALAAVLTAVVGPLVGLGAGLVGFLALSPRSALDGLRALPIAPALWLGTWTGLIWLARRAGLFVDLGVGLNRIEELAPGALAPGLALSGALVGALAGEPAGAMLGEAALTASVVPADPARLTWLAGGLAVGGLGPLLASGAWRAGLRTWGLQLLVLIAWVLILS